MKAVFEIMRILTPIYAFIGVVIGQWLTYQNIEPPLLHTVLGGLMVFCMFAFGNISNDLLDIKADSVSNPTRPLIIGTLTKSEGIILVVCFGSLTLLFGLLGGIQIFLIGLAGLILVTFYNLYLKKVLLVGNISVAVWGIIPILLIPAAFKLWHWKLWIIIPCLTALLLGNEIISGIPDEKGDRLSGRITFATKLGNQRSFFVGGGIILAACLLLSISFIFLHESVFVFLVFWVILFASVMGIGINFFRNDQQSRISRFNKRIVAIVFMLTVIILSISR